MSEVHEIYEREMRDLPCFECRTTVVIELYRVRCPDCGIKAEKIEQVQAVRGDCGSRRILKEPEKFGTASPR